MRIANEILMYFRNNKKRSRDVSIYGPIGIDKEGNEINLLDVFETFDDDIIEKLEEANTLNRLGELMNRVLTDREKTILEMRYGLGGYEEITQRETAAKLGISRSYVSRIEKKAIAKLSKGILK